MHRKFIILCGWCYVLAFSICGAGAESISIQSKSFIRSVDLLDPTQFDPGAQSCQAAMAAIVNCGVIGGEDPIDGSKASGNFRLRSDAQANLVCAGNKIASWELSPVKVDAGNEFIFIATTGELSPAPIAIPGMKGSTAVDKVTLTYRMRGQPNVAGNLLMAQVKPRTCTYIWHTVNATFSCQNGKATATASLSGSAFPSHRVWINNKAVGNKTQGPFDNLWKCDSVDPAIVR